MLQIGAPRLYELLAVISSAPNGCSTELFRSKVFPKAENTRGASRLLCELTRRKFVELRGPLYWITPSGLAIVQGLPLPLEEPQPAASEAASSVVSPPTPHQTTLERCLADQGIPTPPPPSSPWRLAADGWEWSQDAAGNWWSRVPNGSQPPRTRRADGVCWELVGGLHVRPRWLNEYFLPIDERGTPVDAHAVPLAPPELEPQQPATVDPTPWAQGSDGRWWSFWQGTWWTPDAYGMPVPVPNALPVW
jgi:hypothetical protein